MAALSTDPEPACLVYHFLRHAQCSPLQFEPWEKNFPHTEDWGALRPAHDERVHDTGARAALQDGHRIEIELGNVVAKIVGKP